MTDTAPTTPAKPLAIVIEDDEYLGEIFSDVLRGVNLDVRLIRDGENAILQLARVTPILIILDLNLPKYSGANIFTYIRNEARIKDTWVIITTADAVQAADLTRMDHHNLLTLIKPVSVDQLEQLALRVVNSQ
jgi:two-component system phosphate regulon response regulator PhoB